MPGKLAGRPSRRAEAFSQNARRLTLQLAFSCAIAVYDFIVRIEWHRSAGALTGSS
jgi:hypothetical protein